MVSCLRENLPVPAIRSPVFTMAMRDMIVTLSSFTLPEKKRLAELIGFMGGRCVDQLIEEVTHLVTDKVISKKYEQAAVRGIPIMKSDWVTDIWESRRSEYVSGTHERFSKHRVPPFYNLGVTSTGIKYKQKDDIKRLVNENGGKYYGEYASRLISILIVAKDPPVSEKMSAAISSGKDVLTYDWVYDSVEKGYAVPFEKYKVLKKAKPTASTPEKQKRSGGVLDNTNFSNVSNVSYQHTVNETQLSNVTQRSSASEGEPSGEAAAAFQKLDLQAAKLAGAFLDGCNVSGRHISRIERKYSICFARFFCVVSRRLRRRRS